MLDITHKNNTLRVAEVRGIVKVSKKETIAAIRKGSVPKGDVFAVSKAVGLLGIKKTPDLLPDCHPIPIESADIAFEITGKKIQITVSVKTVYKTGVEVEAMHGASVAALNMYDMLKPIDKGVSIEHIRLLNKKGGKSDFTDTFQTPIQAAVIVCSDSVFQKKKEDKAGKAVVAKLKQHRVKVIDYIVIPDEAGIIQEKALQYQKEGVNLIIFSGGTGLSRRDVTPQALTPLLDHRIPGIEEAIRKYGQDRMPYAMLSRSVAGVIADTLLLALPGSTNGAKESMDAIFPVVLHAFNVLKGTDHGR